MRWITSENANLFHLSAVRSQRSFELCFADLIRFVLLLASFTGEQDQRDGGGSWWNSAATRTRKKQFWGK
jgi:hypothetical protein